MARTTSRPAPPPGALRVERLVVGEIETNCYLLSREGLPGAVVLDPGGDAGEIAARIEALGLVPRAFLLTHAHADHLLALPALTRRWKDAPVFCPAAEADWPGDPAKNLSVAFGEGARAGRPDRLVADGERIEVSTGAPGAAAASAAPIVLSAILVPGHTPGGTAYLVAPEEKDAPPLLFSGDILFAGGVGRTDLPGGNERGFFERIRERLLSLPGATRVLPGHGPETTVGEEARTNPFVGA